MKAFASSLEAEETSESSAEVLVVRIAAVANNAFSEKRALSEKFIVVIDVWYVYIYSRQR